MHSHLSLVTKITTILKIAERRFFLCKIILFEIDYGIITLSWYFLTKSSAEKGEIIMKKMNKLLVGLGANLTIASIAFANLSAVNIEYTEIIIWINPEIRKYILRFILSPIIIIS